MFEVENRSSDHSSWRPVVAVSGDYYTAAEFAEHQHRRNQLLYAASGAITVSTPHGSWVAPPERGVWIPAGTPHSVRTIGVVRFRSVLIEPVASRGIGPVCQVLNISSLLHQLLLEAGKLAARYDQQGRDGMIMDLLVAEIELAEPNPISVPFPSHPLLAKRCQDYMKRPHISETIEVWADALSIDRRRFTRLFRRETGMSFGQWRKQACLAVAVQRLVAGESVTSIAFDIGYDSPAGFSVMFKRALGVSPSAYSV